MKDSVALQRYRQRHIETGLPDPPDHPARWHHVVVIPAYREPATLLQNLQRIPAGTGHALVILVLNRPDTDTDTQANEPLRRALDGWASANTLDTEPRIYRLNDHAELLVHDMERSGELVPAAQGVGLARKAGCDIALQWIHAGVIHSDWIFSTDADALLPPDYFLKIEHAAQESVAAIFPFHHMPGPDPQCNEATALYELRLHHYVLGLEYAASPYAHHSLGSCLAVRADAYTQVRGFPRRAGGEDFYLLNKLSKLGPISRATGDCIQLQSRYSPRVPFGTGPAVQKIAAAQQPMEVPLFYHPRAYIALRAVLASIPALRQGSVAELPHYLELQGLEQDLVVACCDALDDMGLADALSHCRQQGKSAQQFLRQFHQWFDAFRSLRFIHCIRDAGWPQLSLAVLASVEPNLWPAGATAQEKPDALIEALNRQWHWTHW